MSLPRRSSRRSRFARQVFRNRRGGCSISSSEHRRPRQRIAEQSEPRMSDLFMESEAINFGDLPENIDDLLQQGVAAYRHDRAQADRLFRQALAAAPTQLPTYFCLYKIHTYQGH